MGSARICSMPGAGSPGGPCGAAACPACSGGACRLPAHIVSVLRGLEGGTRPDLSDAMGLESSVAEALLACGMKPALAGYRYLQVAVRMGLQEPYKLAKVSARLFPAVAEECGTTADCVDRNIRHAVAGIFKEPNEYLLGLFPAVRDGSRKDVPNRWFVCALADGIRRGAIG